MRRTKGCERAEGGARGVKKDTFEKLAGSVGGRGRKRTGALQGGWVSDEGREGGVCTSSERASSDVQSRRAIRAWSPGRGRVKRVEGAGKSKWQRPSVVR